MSSERKWEELYYEPTTKGFLMQFSPHQGTRAEDQQADRFAAVAERQHEQPGPPIFPVGGSRAIGPVP